MELTTLGEVAKYINGRAFKPIEWEEVGLPIIRIQNLNDNNAKYNYTNSIFEDNYLVKNGDLLFAWSASLGAFIWSGSDAWLNQHIFKVVPCEGTYKMYLFYYLLHVIDELYSKTHGSGMVHITLKPFKATAIPLPSLAEQQSIVERIESLFEKLDRAKELAQSAIDSFETRKAAILHKAFTGELTAKWREENGVGMESWEGKKLKELGSFKLGKMLDRAKNKGFPTRYLRNINVRWFDFDLSDIAQIAATEDDKKLFSVEEGDLFICEGGEPGRCAVWEQHGYDLIYQKALHRFRSNGSVVSKLVAYFLLYTSKSDKLSAHFTGTTIKHLTGQSLAEIDIFIPKIPEQEEIVHILDRLFANEQRAKELCNTIEKIDLLKKAILARAFRGELGTNNPMEESSIVLLKETLSS